MMNEKLYFVNENIVLYWQIICLHFRSQAHNVGIFPCTDASFFREPHLQKFASNLWKKSENLHPIFGKSPRICIQSLEKVREFGPEDPLFARIILKNVLRGIRTYSKLLYN